MANYKRERIENIRAAAQMWFKSGGTATQAEIAKEFNVSQPTIASWMRSKEWSDWTTALNKARVAAIKEHISDEKESYKESLEKWKNNSRDSGDLMVEIEHQLLVLAHSLVSPNTPEEERLSNISLCNKVCNSVTQLTKAAAVLRSAAAMSYDQVLGVSEILKVIDENAIGFNGENTSK